MKKILITGCAGFIGFSFAKFLLGLKKYKIYGIDNLNLYYSIKLKKKRLNLLKKQGITFNKIDLSNFIKLENLIKKHKIDTIFNFAAQPGVRYSISNPDVYLKSNINGFFNILEVARKNKIKKIFYASSSSVYGEVKNFPISENEKLLPNNFYGVSKLINEQMADNYSKFYNMNIVGFRFFTVYGEWGRPDMFILKFLEAAKKNKIFELYNNGLHYRDFTYIKDVVSIMLKLSKRNISSHEIFNICSNNPLHLKKVINFFKKNKIKPKIILRGLQTSDVKKTHGDNSLILKKIKNIKFTQAEVALTNTLSWYKKNKNLFK
jgi:UDP-glucuronate 4-epimerase